MSGCLKKSKFSASTDPLINDTGGDDDGSTTLPEEPINIATVEDVVSVPTSSSTNRANNNQPKIKGALIGTAKFVYLYSDNRCSNPLGNGTEAQFEGAGIPISIASDPGATTSTTSIYFRTSVTADGTRTTCPNTPQIRYYFSNQSPITFVGSNQTSDETKDATVTIWGKVTNSAITTLGFYKNPLCTDLIKDNVNVDNFDKFNNPTAAGSVIPLTPNAITNIYAKGFGSGYTGTICTKLKSFRHDDTDPVFAGAVTHARYSTSRTQSPPFSFPAATDSGVGFDHYLYAILATPAGTGTWVKTTDRTGVVATGNFALDQNYFVSVKAVDKLNNISAPIVSTGWTVRTVMPALTIGSPTSSFITALRTVRVSGACVPGIQVKLKQVGGTAAEVVVNCSNYDYAANIEIEGGAGAKEIQVRQVDDSYTNTKTRTITFSPLSSFGQGIAAGNEHSCGVKVKKLYCWGRNNTGQLGNGGANNRDTPSEVTNGNVNLGHSYVHVAAGVDHSCAISSERKALCWGSNLEGQLGINNLNIKETSSALKVDMDNVAERNFIQITTGSYHSCALTAEGKAYCWGLNDYGQLGNGTKDAKKAPTAVSITAPVKQISAGHKHTCALLENDDIRCWGLNNNGQLGLGHKVDANNPHIVLRSGDLNSTSEKFMQVSAGNLQTCAVTSAYKVYCWGNNANGALGVDNRDDTTKITRSAGANDLNFVRVSTGGGLSLDAEGNIQTTCGLTRKGSLYCWGSNNNGQLGIGSDDDRKLTPRLITPNGFAVASDAVYSFVNDVLKSLATTPDNTIAELSVGASHVCARTKGEKTLCWGDFNFGRIGIDGLSQDRRIPGNVPYP